MVIDIATDSFIFSQIMLDWIILHPFSELTFLLRILLSLLMALYFGFYYFHYLVYQVGVQ